MTENSAAWHEGWKAFADGKQQSMNPYLYRHAACAKEWHYGYMAAGDAKAARP